MERGKVTKASAVYKSFDFIANKRFYYNGHWSAPLRYAIKTNEKTGKNRILKYHKHDTQRGYKT